MIRPFGPTVTEGADRARRGISGRAARPVQDGSGRAAAGRPAATRRPLVSLSLPRTMRFPLADWVDGHAGCRYNLGGSGMHGTVRHPLPSPSEVRSASEEELRHQLGELIGVPPSRVFLTHGATEANAWAVTYLARHRGNRPVRCRVRYPEYPPLFDLARSAGYRLVTAAGPTELAIVSQPRNPVGDLWPAEQFADWSRDARATVVDETFREFTPAPSLQRRGLSGLWSTGSFTKAYGADDLRVGYIVPARDGAGPVRPLSRPGLRRDA